MPELTIQNTNPELLLGFGDTALKLGHADAALVLYRAAMRQTKEPSLAMLARIGLAASPNPRAPAMLEALTALSGIDAGTAFVGEGLATWLKHPPFVFDRRFLDLANQHAELLPVPNWHWNLSTALWAAQRARKVDGDFVELGVFKGHTTRFLADYLEFQDWPKTWFLYDTFEGIPQDQLDAGWEDANARAYDGAYSLDEVRQRFADMPNIRVVPGRVPEVLAEVCPETISFLHVDLNNATAEIEALEALFDRISPGGVILFDDFCWTASLRQQRAETAWFEARGEQVLALPTGQGLFVKP